jgi:carbon storage regulator
MLVMRRRTGEAVLIGSDIEIHILSIHRSKVKIGINAPRSIPVCAREVELVRQENLVAALSMYDGPAFMSQLRQVFQGHGAPDIPGQVTDMKREVLEEQELSKEAPCRQAQSPR